jgi:hypothetical protein
MDNSDIGSLPLNEWAEYVERRSWRQGELANLQYQI